MAERAKRNIPERRAVSTVYASLIALLIVFLLLSLLASYFGNYNAALNDQMRTNEQKIQEGVLITGATVSQGKITGIKVKNTGTVELKVRAIYSKSSTTPASFISDPSVYISPQETTNIPTNIAYSPTVSIEVATQRGTLSQEYFVQDWETYEFIFDSENLTMGPMRLKFESFDYSAYDGENWGGWNWGWNPPVGKYLKWRVSVTNLGEETIKLNNHTALTLWDSSNNEIPWYVNSLETVIPHDVPTEIIFLVSKPGEDGTKPSNWQKISGTQTASMMVFLNFFGKILLLPSGERSYGQTIPFEAIVPRN